MKRIRLTPHESVSQEIDSQTPASVCRDTNDSLQDLSTTCTCLGKKTNQWRKRELARYKIHADLKTLHEPKHFVLHCMNEIMEKKKFETYLSHKLDQNKGKVYEEMKACVKVISSALLDVETIEDITDYKLKIMENNFMELRAKLEKIQARFTDETNAFWGKFISRAEVEGEKFLYQLQHMLAIKHSDGVLTDGMYQSLFMHFLAMFNLKVFGFPNLTTKSIKIEDQTFVSVADILVMDQWDVVQEEITAVVNVNCENSKLQEFECNKDADQAHETNDEELSHISPPLLSQHTGELLIHLLQSPFKGKGIFGMIFQNTKVTFTFLAPEKEYLVNLKQGNLKEENCANLKITNEYNILSVNDRKKLLKPLLDLCFLQRMNMLNIERNLLT